MIFGNRKTSYPIFSFQPIGTCSINRYVFQTLSYHAPEVQIQQTRKRVP
jgi:hypothetical protein